MEDGFSDLPEAIRNTLAIVQRCAFMAPKRKPILPSLAGDREGEAAQLTRAARLGLEEVGRAHVDTPVANAHVVSRRMVENHKTELRQQMSNKTSVVVEQTNNKENTHI